MKTALMKVSVVGSLCMFAACSHSPPVQEVKVEAPEFKVKEAAPGGREAWIDDPYMFAQKSGLDMEKYYYYSAEAKGAEKRLTCEKAQANLVDDIAKQVATYVDTSIARASAESNATDSSGNDQSGQVNEETQRLSSQLSRVSVNKMQIKKTYWEKRDYSEAGGAKSLYHCWVFAAVEQKAVDRMVDKANSFRIQEDPSLKAKLGAKLEQLPEGYEEYQKTHN